MAIIQRTNMLSGFTCLGDKCVDTCCRGWSMQLDDKTLRTYQSEAPELLKAVEESPDGWIMRKDPATGYCVKLEGGWCGIHKEKGDRFLGDACYFYPRATRALGKTMVMTATMSCPEIARFILEAADPFSIESVEAERLPNTVKDYLPAELSAEQALEVHQAFIAATHDTASVEQIFCRIASVSRSIELIDKETWPSAVPFYLKHADARIPAPEKNIHDPFNLLHALSGLIVASKKPMPLRLAETVECMERVLAVKLDWQNVLIHADAKSIEAFEKISAAWNKVGAPYDNILKRWLGAQLSLSLFPFAGLGNSLTQRSTLIGVRLATVRLALMCAHAEHGSMLPQETIIRVLQSLSRFLDHLGDPSFSLQIYNETGWTKEARLVGLLTI